MFFCDVLSSKIDCQHILSFLHLQVPNRPSKGNVMFRIFFHGFHVTPLSVYVIYYYYFYQNK